MHLQLEGQLLKFVNGPMPQQYLLEQMLKRKKR